MSSKQSLVKKKRTCKNCKVSFYMTAEEVKEHAQMCVRLSRLGLVGATTKNIVVNTVGSLVRP